MIDLEKKPQLLSREEIVRLRRRRAMLRNAGHMGNGILLGAAAATGAADAFLHTHIWLSLLANYRATLPAAVVTLLAVQSPKIAFEIVDHQLKSDHDRKKEWRQCQRYTTKHARAEAKRGKPRNRAPNSKSYQA